MRVDQLLAISRDGNARYRAALVALREDCDQMRQKIDRALRGVDPPSAADREEVE